MKWCTNCQANKESWAEKTNIYSSDYDKRCWSCNKYTLDVESKKIICYERTQGCKMGGGTWVKSDYHFSDGTSTHTYIKKGHMGPDRKIEVPPKRSPSPTCRIT